MTVPLLPVVNLIKLVRMVPLKLSQAFQHAPVDQTKYQVLTARNQLHQRKVNLSLSKIHTIYLLLMYLHFHFAMEQMVLLILTADPMVSSNTLPKKRRRTNLNILNQMDSTFQNFLNVLV